MYRHALALMALVVASSVTAQDLTPGLWEITMETRVEGAAGFAPAPYKLKQCLTAADAGDPSRVLGPLANPGASGCTYTDKGYQGGNFRFTMECAGTLSLKTQGEVSFSASRMSGSMITTGNLLGQSTRIRSQVSAQRMGSC